MILSVVPEKLRGYVSRWLFEVHPNVFVGRPSARVRDKLWETVQTNLAGGRAVMTYPSNKNEQGFIVLTHNSQWEMTDFDGISLALKPANSSASKTKAGWSQASRRRANYRRKRS
ncbi:type I-E CRISPR-associated endoribonuclease Cas2e [Corynebacterium breve]|uniref:Type I-E CRISPR-associated endoribonuclease Cas2e n=1 Tax=Corynebacterium breve TaxID=3049799 RepID=A0ABY8VDH8_9CORY|nr:type I-E CRISPR-associated endoribonuclease Cas2e [Corynebacterium breve]WIM67719.1 type I-E CRISPR-associated endoribonuclease Cas2e [Corynebacterium breve]